MAAMQVLQHALQAADLRQQVYANNIANVETPGYKREDVAFESMLQAALEQSDQAAGNSLFTPSGSSLNLTSAAAVVPQIVMDTSTQTDNNGNNVDLDAEMADMAENQIRYETLLQALTDQFSRLKTAIDN
ncbi:MAG: flagellar basal body rod protein FlgB [Alicyclobacillus sp.]|nr:flagellar basal body rod protein FlgB [Alicyclobacillus sp.]